MLYFTNIYYGTGFAFGGSNNFAQNVDGNVTMANIEFYSSDGHTCYDKSDIKENNVDFHFNEYDYLILSINHKKC